MIRIVLRGVAFAVANALLVAALHAALEPPSWSGWTIVYRSLAAASLGLVVVATSAIELRAAKVRPSVARDVVATAAVLVAAVVVTFLASVQLDYALTNLYQRSAAEALGMVSGRLTELRRAPSWVLYECFVDAAPFLAAPLARVRRAPLWLVLPINVATAFLVTGRWHAEYFRGIAGLGSPPLANIILALAPVAVPALLEPLACARADRFARRGEADATGDAAA